MRPPLTQLTSDVHDDCSSRAGRTDGRRDALRVCTRQYIIYAKQHFTPVRGGGRRRAARLVGCVPFSGALTVGGLGWYGLPPQRLLRSADDRRREAECCSVRRSTVTPPPPLPRSPQQLAPVQQLSYLD